jgi:transcriptional regulator with PAS, ATPase and Fis domain
MEEIEKEAIKDALRRNNGNKRKAAEELKISERTIHRWIKEIENEKE